MRDSYWVDLHGCLVVHQPPEDIGKPLVFLPGRIEWSVDVAYLDAEVYITTAMAPGYRDFLIGELTRHRFIFTDVIMGVGSGRRYLVNDTKPNGLVTAHHVALTRNQEEWPLCVSR